MSTVKLSEELDFRLLFEEDGRHAGGLEVRTPPTSTQVLAQPFIQELHGQPTTAHYQHVQGPPYEYMPQYGPHYESQYRPQYGTPRAFGCPSIQITSIAANSHTDLGGSQEVLAVGGADGPYPEASGSRAQLYLPLDPCFRDTTLCPSPCSSLSSRSWISDLSSCESFSRVYDEEEGELHDVARLALGSPIGSPQGSPGCGGGAFGVELWQQKYQHSVAFSPALSPYQSPRQSPCHSPRTSVTEDTWLNRRPTSRPSSRPTSPCGKRRHTGADPYARSPSPHHSPSPTPGTSPRGSVTQDTWVGNPADALGSLLLSSLQELDVPSKTRRTSGSQRGLPAGHEDPVAEPLLGSTSEEGRERDGLAELFLHVPSNFSWTKPKPGNAPLFRSSSPPPLDWPLPDQFNQYELKLEVQPRAFHRAHYETEGSRGAIKADPGGHPVIKLLGSSEQLLSLLLFIGTADDRYLRPHSFYQVHRVTGKMVTTSCQEKVMGSTKVLEIPLLPENSMSASIDCAGILKLRNADIELKKGETVIGRKNTKVRVVFRVGVPQPDGWVMWLQAASVPVECSQRSGQDLPQVQTFSPASCCVDGGQQLVIRGSNMAPSSRVVFMQTGADGRTLWETEAAVDPDRSGATSVVVEVPPYSKKATNPVQVQFYVSNGKKRRSQPQSFTYMPAVKQELWDRISHNPPGFCPTSRHRPDEVYYDSGQIPVLHHAAPSILPLQTPLLFPHPSSSMASAVNPQISSLPPPSSRRTFVSPAVPLKDPLPSSPAEALSVKQEPEDPHPNVGLREITLDDVNEIIGRDIGNHGDRYDSTGRRGTQ